jgi:hypothetical protein
VVAATDPEELARLDGGEKYDRRLPTRSRAKWQFLKVATAGIFVPQGQPSKKPEPRLQQAPSGAPFRQQVWNPGASLAFLEGDRW